MKRWTINFVTGAFAVALALLYVLVLRSIAVQIVSPPEALMEPYPDTSTEELCQAAGGRWVTRGAAPGGHESAPVDEDSPPYCQGPLAFEREREAQAEKSRQISLFVFAIGGGVAVAASLMVSLLRPVAPGLMLGGIAAFFIAGVHIWTLAPGLGRLVTIVVIFVALVSIGLYALREEHTS
ncbi:MAG: hypothetical protein ACREQV_18020 [Candidatus Binatia bacterium]